MLAVFGMVIRDSVFGPLVQPFWLVAVVRLQQRSHFNLRP
jgi:hypothetical protein